MSNTNALQFFATTPKGLELLLVDELRSLGATDAAEKLAGVTFTGDLTLAYKACLWSRLANRILLRLTQVPASTPEELYAGVQTIDWSEHLRLEGTLRVNFVSSHSNITHTLFGAQKVKDAIVDQFREQFSMRPTVAADKPDLSIHVYLNKDIASISLDLSGESLHRRGYRLEQGAAPLKENLAAAILLRAGWPALAKENAMLFDPMCGSGTLLIEAALMAGEIAPGLLHHYFGFLGWKKHNADCWAALRKGAEQKRELHLNSLPTIVGYDQDSHAIKIAFANIERAGLRGKIHVERRELSACTPKTEKGLLITNPPYGERLGEHPELKKLYAELGALLKQEFTGWRAGVFTGNSELGKTMGLRSSKYYALFNGAIPCQLLLFDVKPEYFIDRSPATRNELRIKQAQKNLTEADLASAQMFANRLRKNLKKLKSWIERENVSCYRIYDADLPEYAVSVDRYEDAICIQEYHAPKTVNAEKAARRLQHIFAVIAEAVNLPPAKIFFRDPESRLDDIDSLYMANELNQRFLVNLSSRYSPLSLSPEQRLLRKEIQAQAKDKHFLNVFSGAGTMSVMAALGRASSVTSLDENEFYMAWAKQNMLLNQQRGQFVHDDVIHYLRTTRLKFDMVFVELPDSTFHLRQNHPDFLPLLTHVVRPGGMLYLVTRDTRFKSDDISADMILEDISKRVLPYDFEQNPRVQQVFKAVKKPT